MINNISFTGREEMLTAGLEKAAKKVVNKAEAYVGPGKIFENAERKVEQKGIDSIYTSPFAPIDPNPETKNNVLGKIINFFG